MTRDQLRELIRAARLSGFGKIDIDGHYADAILPLINCDALAVLREIVSQVDQGGSEGKVFARDACITRARELIKQTEASNG